jgi:DNA polymerase-3 subunit beta
MRCTIDRDVLTDAVAWAARTLPARPAIPILAGMLIEAAGSGELTLSSFDYEASGQVTIEATVTEPGRVLVPGRLLTDIVRSLPAQPVRIVTDGSETVLTCGSAEFGLLTMPVEDYPDLPRMPAAAGTVESDVLAAAVAQVVVASSRDDTLPMLTGVRVDIEGTTMRLACTDRYRIAARELPWTPSRPEFAVAAVVPARTLADTARSLRSGTPTELAMAGVADSLMGLTCGGRRMTTRLLDDQFIDYRSRLTADWTIRARVPVAPFIEAIKRVALVAERTTPLRLAFSQEEVRIRAATGDAARANELLPAELEGDDIDVAFNPQFLLDGLAGISSDLVNLDFAAPSRPALLSGDADDFRYLLMPIRLSG